MQADGSHRKLDDVVFGYILSRPHNDDHTYLLAEVCLSNALFANLIFGNIVNYIVNKSHRDEKYSCASASHGANRTHRDFEDSTEETHMQKLRACYAFLKCSYWLPRDRLHYVDPDLLELLICSIGQIGLDEQVHDTLSAFLSLLSEPSVAVLRTSGLPFYWFQSDSSSGKSILLPGALSVLSDSLFKHFQQLPLEYFSNSGKAFRTWFQWISYMNDHDARPSLIYAPEYWLMLRTGLLTGMADQRRFCLGIIQQTLNLCQRSFEASGMVFDMQKKKTTLIQYQKYCALFEIIVLDRYPNQVQACLPELTALLGPTSLIASTWTTALLAAALNSKIQEGVRKLIGNWYLDYATSQPESCTAHASFLVEGILPWATQGSLFTSSLVSTRTSTRCSHGEALSEAFARIVVAASQTMPDSENYSSNSSDLFHGDRLSSRKSVVSERQAIVKGVLQYVIDTGGKIFSPAVLYLLEGIIRGIRSGVVVLDASEIDMIIRISRMPALPEIAAELCRTYCVELCAYRNTQKSDGRNIYNPDFLEKAVETLRSEIGLGQDHSQKQGTSMYTYGDFNTFGKFLEELNQSQHKIIQDERFASAYGHIVELLEGTAPDGVLPIELCQLLDAFWEEADRQDYCRPVAIRLAPLFLHPCCVDVLRPHRQVDPENSGQMKAIITKALTTLHQFAEGRTYLVSGLAKSLRKAVLLHPDISEELPLDDFFVRFIEQPPLPKKEFLFEVVAAEKLKEHLPRLMDGKAVPNRDYEDYYGQREWVGYAAVIDLLNRIPESQEDVAKRVMKRLLEPWRTQKAPIPIISKFKNVFQLQIMLVLTQSCVTKEDADWYLDSFMHALVLEPWPRYRYLLEWIITRIYFRFPEKAHRILDDLAHLDDNSPVHIASLMKLALLAAPFLDSADFALRLMVQLIPFSASPKVHIRHEAHWCFPTLFDLAKERKWLSITENPAFIALDKHVRSLDKFNVPPSTIRTLKLEAVKDFTLTNIFQGRYLKVETPDMEYVAREDFVLLSESDTPFASKYLASSPRVPLGEPLPTADLVPVVPVWKKQASTVETASASTPEPTSLFFQTKSGFDIAALLPSPGPPSAHQNRPASVILIASLIDNPTNLGGLSRISESFGLESLYIDDMRKMAHKDFKATSVTSEKHLPIHELKVPALPSFLLEKKREGYEVVGIEQTDRSGMLGEEEQEGGKGLGMLPRKCVLVLGAERSGITSEVLAVVDRCVEIKTVGVTRSLNVQTAGGIAVFEWWREWGGAL